MGFNPNNRDISATAVTLSLGIRVGDSVITPPIKVEGFNPDSAFGNTRMTFSEILMSLEGKQSHASVRGPFQPEISLMPNSAFYDYVVDAVMASLHSTAGFEIWGVITYPNAKAYVLTGGAILETDIMPGFAKGQKPVSVKFSFDPPVGAAV